MKALPFPYAIAAELFLFGPPAKKLTLFHLLIPITMGLSAMGVFLTLEPHIGWLYSLVCAIPIALLVAYAVLRLVAVCLPLMRWMVFKGILQEPDEERLTSQIIKNANWEIKESPEKKS